MNGQQHAPAALYPQERPGPNFTGGWVGPRAGLDGRDSIPDLPARNQSLYRLSYRAHLYINVCMCVCVCVYVYIYIYIYIKQQNQGTVCIWLVLFLFNVSHLSLQH